MSAHELCYALGPTVYLVTDGDPAPIGYAESCYIPLRTAHERARNWAAATDMRQLLEDIMQDDAMGCEQCHARMGDQYPCECGRLELRERAKAVLAKARGEKGGAQ